MFYNSIKVEVSSFCVIMEQ